MKKAGSGKPGETFDHEPRGGSGADNYPADPVRVGVSNECEPGQETVVAADQEPDERGY
jgi:hypothetical protein